MPNKNLNKFILLFILLNSCVKQPDPNPCADKKPVTAGFKIKEPDPTDQYGKLLWEPYFTDTVLTKQAVFIADQDTNGGTTYLWEIGKAKYTGRQITVDFSERPKGDNRIPIKLTVISKPNTSCFPQDSGRVTFSKLLVLVGEKTEAYIDNWTYENSLLTGTYTGYVNGNKAKLDTLIIGRMCIPDTIFGRPNPDCYPTNPPYGGTVSYYKYGAKMTFQKSKTPFSSFILGYKQAANENGNYLTILYPDNNHIKMKAPSNRDFIGVRINR